MDEYNAVGKLVHEARAQDGERLDLYLARVRPDLGDQAFWYAQCDQNRVEVRDHWNQATHAYGGKGWFLRWFDGTTWVEMDLAEGERPRMRNGFCHIVKE